jgi:hypothetical protein
MSQQEWDQLLETLTGLVFFLVTVDSRDPYKCGDGICKRCVRGGALTSCAVRERPASYMSRWVNVTLWPLLCLQR